MPVTVHLIRHGQVENPKGVIYGRLPGYHLSERGVRQARGAAQHLKDADLATIWASPLERAQETAAEIAAPHGLEIVTDDRLIESGNTFEGVGRTVWHLFSNPAHWWRFRNPLKPSWGESFAEIRVRMMSAITEAAAGAEGREIAIVSHQTPVIVARLALAKRRVPPWLGGAPCETGSVSTLVLDDGVVLSASYFSAEATDS
ncbi:MAG TPA: histidine phosphatase family protein [Actinomycetota bacterium]|nr:histidine phosphatase family protein [Actinomycetota bacterium]